MVRDPSWKRNGRRQVRPSRTPSRTPGFFGPDESTNPTIRPEPAGRSPVQSPVPGSRGQFDYRQASAPTRRFLTATGMVEPYQQEPPKLPEFETDEDTRKAFGNSHSYRLTPWQTEQAGLDYGLTVSSSSPRLWGDQWETVRVTRESWDRMTPEQQNALRFNEGLTQAVKQDFALNEDGDNRYKNRVADMFGSQGGSDTYAPKTFEYLETLGMKDLRGQDLDEYLSLDRAFSAQEVAALQPWDEPVAFSAGTGFAADRSSENTLQLDRYQIEQAGRLVEQALANPQGWDEGSNFLMAAGLRPTAADIPFGYLDLENGESRLTDAEQAKEEYFQAWMKHLIETPDDLVAEDLWYDADSLGLTDADMNEFFGYVRDRSYGLDQAGAGANPNHRTGAQIRALLGLEG